MPFENILIRKTEGIGWIVLNRPEKLSAINRQTLTEVRRAFGELVQDEEARVIGAGVRGSDRSLSEGPASEKEGFDRVGQTQDLREGILAFLEKRKPTWSGK